ncbi:MAG: hypothetical protein KIT81_06185 [Alphaproteobacteria bacterium]|nr:hypothetical protein [Alphaproteobacteria bacterium]
MPFLVSDTSVLIDLERGTLLEAAFRLPDTLVVPDLLYERELKQQGGARLQELGLRVEELSAEMLAVAVGVLRANPLLSAADCFALTLAEANGWTLLTGDGPLRALALAQKLECHGVLWLLDRMLDAEAATAATLHLGLTAIAEHPRCRLPPREVRLRLERYAAARG